MDNLHLKTNDEIEQHIRSESQKEQELKEQKERYENLTVKVRLEDLFNECNPTKEQKKNFNLWMKMYKDNYIDLMHFLIGKQISNSKDLFNVLSENPTEYRIRMEQEEDRNDKRNKRISKIVWGTAIGFLILLYLLLFTGVF